MHSGASVRIGLVEVITPSVSSAGLFAQEHEHRLPVLVAAEFIAPMPEASALMELQAWELRAEIDRSQAHVIRSTRFSYGNPA